MKNSRGAVFVATETFAEANPEPAEILAAEGFELRRNPHNRRLTREDYPACYAGVPYVIAGLEPYDDAVFAAHPSIRVVSRIGIGVDAIDLKAANTRGVAVYNTPAAPSKSVAELTVGFILGLIRGLAPMNSDFHGQRWAPRLGRELEQMTVGLLGFGRIGKMTAARLQPFGCRMIACDPEWDASQAEALRVKRVDFDEILAESDILSLHLPLSAETRHLIDAGRLDRMKRDAFLINTSRGGILDDRALIERLVSRRLAGAALDVFECEPDTAPYANVPNLLLSPHIGSNTREARYRMEIGAVRNLLAYVEAIERGTAAPPGLTP